ncbi:MAG: NADH-quinone oxidoreductase subunit C [Desulfobacterales bacterium]
MQEATRAITLESLLAEVARLKAEGWRFVTLTASELDAERLELLYHFDRELRLQHLRAAVAKTAEVPSISPVFFAAALVENEVQDLFGLRFTGLLLDFRGRLYLEEESPMPPFCRRGREAEAPRGGGGSEAPGGESCATR